MNFSELSLTIYSKQGLEQNLEDQLEIEYSPTYWLHNNTVVPTTTQRTTTSTSTQSVHKSIFSTSMSSNEIEKITERMSIGDDEENEAKDSGAFNKISLMTFVVLCLLRSLF